MKSDSSETVGQTSSRGSDGTKSSPLQEPKRARVQAGTNRGELQRDSPLDRIYVVTPSRDIRAVKRSFWLNTALGLVMIALLVFGSIFGVIFSVVETHGAFATVGNPTTSSDTVGTSTPSVVTTLVPSIFSTLVPSSFSTLVPSEVTIYVQSDATTLVISDATTLIPSVITVAQRDATAPAQIAGISPTALVKKKVEVTSTTGLVMSITTTVTVAVYSTTFGRYDLQSDSSGIRHSQQTCGNGARSVCTSTTEISQATQSTFVTSALSAVSASLLDLNFTIATTVMPDSAATTTMTTTNDPDATVDKATITFSMMCAITDVSSLLPCNPVPTGWYISPSPPRVTSFLHPVFRIISNCLFRVTDSSAYQFLRLSATKALNQCGKVFVNAGGGQVVNSILSLIPPGTWA